MADTISISATGISPAFPITAEEFKLWRVQSVTRVGLDGVEPPLLGAGGGVSEAHRLFNLWYPWIDDKLLEPKYDGVAKYLGMPSNRPSPMKDYHTIALMRATDYILAPKYVGLIRATAGSAGPAGGPQANGGST